MPIKNLIARFVTSLRDPVTVAMEREDIRAAANYWRQRIANARIAGMDGNMETSVNSPFSVEELDSFELSVANQIARSFVLTPKDNWLFQERGLDIGFYAHIAARHAGAANKLSFTGFHTRLRILPGKEVAYEEEPYGSLKWTTIWSAKGCAEEQIAA